MHWYLTAFWTPSQFAGPVAYTGLVLPHLQDEYGNKWSGLEKASCGKEELERDGINSICSMLCIIHLPQQRGVKNPIAELKNLFERMTDGHGFAFGESGPAFFDHVLEPYAKVVGALSLRMPYKQHDKIAT